MNQNKSIELLEIEEELIQIFNYPDKFIPYSLVIKSKNLFKKWEILTDWKMRTMLNT